jgi:hypothetical protein
MSISDEIAALESAGKLFRIAPFRTTKPAKRRMYLSERAANDLLGRQSAIQILGLRADVAAAMTRWVVGEWVYGNPRAKRFLHRLDSPPPEVWEFRVTEPDVQVRIIGRFAEVDTFIASRIHTRAHLGDYGSQAWQDAKDDASTMWSELFPERAPHSGTWMHHYIGEDFDDYELQRQRPDGARIRAVRNRTRPRRRL